MTTNGGWLHPLGMEQKPRTERPKPEPTVNCAPLMAAWKQSSPDRTEWLAKLLGVDPLPLRLLGVAWADPYQAWSFPMRDGRQRIVGIRLRNERGDKWTVKGSRSGLFVPQVPPTKRVVICEGPSDVAALLHIGLFSIGRPSCNEGSAMLCDLLPRLGVQAAVIIADHDTDKLRPDGSRYNPGVDGAVRLSEQLSIANCIWIPPTKDAREFVRHGGTAIQIESLLKGMRWKQPIERN